MMGGGSKGLDLPCDTCGPNYWDVLHFFIALLLM
jgi:hypothetical protein